MVHTLVSQIGILALIATAVFAYFKGDAAERWGVALICISWLGGDDVSFLLGKLFSQADLELTLLAMDAILAAGFLYLALRFTKVWLGVAMLMQSIELALHGAVMADFGFSYRQYAVCNNMVSIGLLVLLATATIIAWAQRERTERAPAPAFVKKPQGLTTAGALASARTPR